MFIASIPYLVCILCHLHIPLDTQSDHLADMLALFPGGLTVRQYNHLRALAVCL
jgi:hypothetical protein